MHRRGRVKYAPLPSSVKYERESESELGSDSSTEVSEPQFYSYPDAVNAQSLYRECTPYFLLHQREMERAKWLEAMVDEHDEAALLKARMAAGGKVCCR